MVIFLLIIILTLVGLLAYAGYRVEVLQAHMDEVSTTDHAACIAHIASVVSSRFAATVLREAAKDWDSAGEMPRIVRLGREVYKAGGPSMPEIWLNDRADRIDPEVSELSKEKTA